MGRMWRHLQWVDRLKIERALKEGMTPSEIAETLRVSVPTVYKEIKRGAYERLNSDLTTAQAYSPEVAQAQYERNLSAKGRGLKIGNDRELAAFIEEKIVDEKLSPAACVAMIKRSGNAFKTRICEKTIYNYIDKGVFLRLTNKDLPLKGQKKRNYKRVRRLTLPKGTSIEERPPEVAARDTFGHWEMDCICGKKRTRAALLVLTERLTRYEVVLKIKDKTAMSVIRALDKLERQHKAMFPLIFRTITVDNGVEFSNQRGIERSIYRQQEQRTRLFYCHPYSAYERGTNENSNRMLRRLFPKGSAFTRTTAAEIHGAEVWLNNYPRRIFGFNTAAQRFREEIQRMLAENA